MMKYLAGVAVALEVAFVAANVLPPGKTELDYCREIAADMPDATLEYRTPDGSRVDILTPDVSYEIDYAPKWSQGVGQALYYGIATDRRAGLILLMKDGEDEKRFYLRALAVCAKYDIRLETRRVE